MAVPSPSPQEVLPKEVQKSSSSELPEVPLASEPTDEGQVQPMPTANGSTEQPPAVYEAQTAEHSGIISTPELNNVADSTAGAGQAPTSSPVGVEAAVASIIPVAPPAPAPRESLHENQKDKNGVKPEEIPDSPTTVARNSSPPNHPGSSEGPTSPKLNGVNASKSPPSPRNIKSSFLSKLLRVLVPCVSPSPGTHPVELSDSSSFPPSKEKDSQNPPELISSDLPLSAPPPKTITPPPGPELVEPPPLTAPESSRVLSTTPASPDSDGFVPPTPPPQLLPLAETHGATSGAVQPPGSTGVLHEKGHSRDSAAPSNATDGEESEDTSYTEDDDMDGLDDDDDEDKLIMNGGAGIPIGPDGIPKPLLPPISPQHAGRKCLILDLDETLVHSSFKSIQQADYVVPVEIEYHWHNVYVIKRPGVDNFLKKMGEIYEVVVFTASLSKYADPVLDKLDIHQVVSHRLFRESCYNHNGNYVKDLSQLGRPIADTIILDNSPASYIFHPNNAVPVSSWFNDPHDTELTDLIPFLADLATVEDVRGVLDGAR